MQATLTFLGTGTSMGVPTLGCPCDVCADAVRPASPNRRTRPSLLLHYNDHNVLIDTGPDFHAQAIRENLRSVDAVLYTHGHADHILGMDDLRPLTFHHPEGLDLYADDATANTIERVFEYTFRKINRYPTSARVHLHRIGTGPGTTIPLFGATFQRIPVTHGRETITGYRFGSAAYLTDMSNIPAESLSLLAGLDILILDALRREPHPSHSHLANSIALVEKIAPKRAFFTHISHDLDHNKINAELPTNIRLAHDGLQLQFDIAPEAIVKTFRSLSELASFPALSVVTIGNFDGVHCGHQAVIAHVIDRARAINAAAVAVTFDPHPADVLRGSHLQLITPLDEKLRLLAATGLDATLVLPFTEELRHWSARHFAERVLRDALRAAEVHEGETFRFGHGAEADIHTLEQLGSEMGFAVYANHPVIARGSAISSSRIRRLIAAGSLAEARALLGRSFSVHSTPASGRGYGTRYTVPTINLAPYADLLPANGVYITTLKVGDTKLFRGVTNAGNRPTFGADSFAVETYLLDFEPIALSESTPLELSFLHRLRSEQRFDSPDSLRTQIGHDVARAKRYFALAEVLKVLELPA